MLMDKLLKKKKLNVKEVMKLIDSKKSINGVMKAICGELLGWGLHRQVYVLKQNPEYVVKIETTMSNAAFANATEWRHYIDNKEWTWLEQWLAPCEMISTNGQVLIQRRVQPGKRKDYPKHVPIFFTDLKLTNGGWIDGKFVFCDYSFMVLAPVSTGKKSMKYAKWWGTLKQPIKKK